MAPTYPNASDAQDFQGVKRYFRGRPGFLGSSTRAGHYGFFGPSTRTSGGGWNFFDPAIKPQPRYYEPQYRPLIHRGKTFGKRVGVSLLAEYERGSAWRLWAARVGKFALAAELASPAVDLALLGWGLYRAYDRTQPEDPTMIPAGDYRLVDSGSCSLGPPSKPWVWTVTHIGSKSCFGGLFHSQEYAYGVVTPMNRAVGRPGGLYTWIYMSSMTTDWEPNQGYVTTSKWWQFRGHAEGYTTHVADYVPAVPGRDPQWVAMSYEFPRPHQNPYNSETTPILEFGMDPVPLPYNKAGTGAAVGLEGSYGNGGNNAPPYFDTPAANPPWQPPGQPVHENRPPAKNEREGKARTRLSTFRRVVGAVYGGYTEFGDLVNSWYKALPSKLRTELWAANGYKPLSQEEKLMALWYSHKSWVNDPTFYAKGIGNMIVNEVQDRAIGYFPGRTQKSLRNNPYWRRPVGAGAGGRFTQPPRIVVR